MRKNIVILFVFLFGGAVLNAQGLDLGVKAGYLYSKMDVKGVQNLKTEPKSGYCLGAFARISGERIFFQPELLYRVRTADFKFKELIDDKVEVECKTLDIPLQLGVKVLDLSIVKIAVHAGPVLSLKLSEETKLESVAKNVEDYIKDYKDFVWSGQLGVSVDVARFVVGLSYEKGFSDMAEKGVGKNDLFMATMGIKLF